MKNLTSRFFHPSAWKMCRQADNSLRKGCLTWIRLSRLLSFFQHLLLLLSSQSSRYVFFILLILKNAFQDNDPPFSTVQSWNAFPPISNLTLVALFIESLLVSADHSDNFWFSIDLHNCFTLRALALIFGIILVLFFQRPVSSSFLSLLSNIPKQIKKKKKIVIRKIEKPCFIENICFLFILNSQNCKIYFPHIITGQAGNDKTPIIPLLHTMSSLMQQN